MTTIIVGGALANKPLNGGEAWVRLNWVLGFKQLGFNVVFVEQISRDFCVDPHGQPAPIEASLNLDYFRKVTAEFGLAGAVTLLDTNGKHIYGLERDALLERAGSAELLVNISGHLTWEPLLRRVQRRAYVDIDPGYTQFWHADRTIPFEIRDHDFYFTIAGNIGRPDCPIPTDGIAWKTVRQPVVLEHWPIAHSTDCKRFTTVASWRGAFGPIRVGRKMYGVKAHAFREFAQLPRRAPQTFEMALNIHPADVKDRTLLQQNGWRLVDPLVVAADPHKFRRYIQQSGAEFSAAQAIYTDTNCGWFSDRTTRYLASGKPTLVQETGFSRYLPCGEGLLSFSTMQEAVEGAARIEREYEAHCRAARDLAERYFEARSVLGQFLEQTGVIP